MNQQERENTLRWINAWKKAAPFLEEDKQQQIRKANPLQFIKETAGLVKLLLDKLPIRISSGLVEQQFFFGKYHRQ